MKFLGFIYKLMFLGFIYKFIEFSGFIYKFIIWIIHKKIVPLTFAYPNFEMKE